MTKPETTAELGFLNSGGEMAALMRSHDWESSSLGSPAAWPQSLRTAVGIVLTSRYAMWMGWGKSLSFLYNDAYRPTLGIKHPWALGSPATEVWAEIWDEIGPRVRSVLATGQATYDEALLLFLERSGFPEETYHTFSYSPLADGSGDVSGMLCVVTEETERVISERRMGTLRDFAASLASANCVEDVLRAIDHRNDRDLPFVLTYLFDAHGQARLGYATGLPANHPAAPEVIPAGLNLPWPAGAMFGHPGPLVIEELPDNLPSGAWDTPPVRASMVPIRQQGHEAPAGFLVVGLNPYRRYDEAYSGFVDLLAGQLAAGLANARAYEEERRRAEALAELDRAKTAFFSNVSHEFRTPLTLMLGPVEDLLANPDLGIENREPLNVIHRSGLRLQRLVNNLLDFSRIEAGRAQALYQPTQLASFTAELASSFRSAMERAGLEYRVECGDLPEPVYVDLEMWEKVVFNLISNAFKYTLAGSVVVKMETRDGVAEFSVADTGSGIPEAELPRVFERFHRAEQARGRTHEGTGIGLALVQELVLLHGGKVSATSVVGEGSTFTVTVPFGFGHLPTDRLGDGRQADSIPLHADSYIQEALRWLPASTATPAPTDPVVVGRILVADDNADMRDYICRLLGRDYEVIPVANGAEALAAAIADPPDLILSDLMMPVLDGFGLLHALRSHPSTRTVPFILLSARAGEESSVEGLRSGADDYLVKPFSARELRARVASHLALQRDRQRANEQMNQIFRQAPVGIVVMRGRDCVVELANPTYLTLLKDREVVGRPFAEVMPDLGAHVWAALVSVLDTGEPFVANDFFVAYDQDGDGVPEDHWFNVVYHPLQKANGVVEGIIAVVIEVTVQMRARQELERANRELEEFAYVSSHDLQEPLRMVNIYSELLVERTPAADGEAQEYAGFVRQGVRRMEGLIQDLLVYSRVVHPEQEQGRITSLDQSLDEAIEVLRMRIEETRAKVLRTKLPDVIGEERQLALVFQNLLANALKYQQRGAEPVIEVTAEVHGAECVIRVKDNGIGFDARYAERIFGLFKRLHNNAYPGTGLGLAICQRIVERYKGRIWAASDGEGRGAMFSFSLRRASR